jgi:two-component system copper resistance phosphate regulon response regulator CusR
MRILIIEDDPQLAAVLVKGLLEEGFEVAQETDFHGGREHALTHRSDVIVLDVMLPGGNGFDLCRELRRRGVDTPVLMLTARDSVDDRVLGLESGADDYLTKPFAFRELVARLRALLRRRPPPLPELVTIGDLTVNLKSRQVERGGKRIVLTAKEFSLLEFLVHHKDEVVDRASISTYVWDENHDPFTNVLEVLVRRLRRKIDDGFDHKLIQTLRGAGYRLGL